MLEVAELACWRNERLLFQGLEFRVAAGEILHLRGENGAGKSTLLRILCGLRQADAGQVRWRGQDLFKAPRARDHLVYVGHANGLPLALRPAEGLAQTCRIAGIPSTAAERAQALEAARLSACSDRDVAQLSQGLRRRLALARLVLSSQRPLWLLDEPFNALDNAGVAWVASLLQAHRAAGGVVVMTSHTDTCHLDAVRTLDLGAFA